MRYVLFLDGCLFNKTVLRANTIFGRLTEMMGLPNEKQG